MNGITIISLVVTIVILLILAGISISMLNGRNGVVNKSIESKQKTEEAREKEAIGIASTTAQIGSNGYQELNQSNLQDSIDIQFGKNKAVVIDNGDGTFIIKINNNEYYMSNSREITKLEKVNDKTPRTIIWKWYRKLSLSN